MAGEKEDALPPALAVVTGPVCVCYVCVYVCYNI